ncbi:polyphosphate kinase [Algibacter lectus]|uniref:Polyphosphate kinase n=1 Tax=Algibacter lectus TaxID=221126 RepID=A0A090X141_9FLAO|nr:polyphosphate kinase [Algibacter lectus]
MGFPSLGRQDLLYDKIDPLPIKGLTFQESIFQAITKKDYLLYAPIKHFLMLLSFCEKRH